MIARDTIRELWMLCNTSQACISCVALLRCIASLRLWFRHSVVALLYGGVFRILPGHWHLLVQDHYPVLPDNCRIHVDEHLLGWLFEELNALLWWNNFCELEEDCLHDRADMKLKTKLISDLVCIDSVKLDLIFYVLLWNILVYVWVLVYVKDSDYSLASWSMLNFLMHDCKWHSI